MTPVDTRGPVTEAEQEEIDRRERAVLDGIALEILRSVANAPGFISGAFKDRYIRLDRKVQDDAKRLVKWGYLQ